MFEVNDVVKFKDISMPIDKYAVITKVDSEDYVQLLDETGKTFSAAYTGYLKPTNMKLDISTSLAMLREMEK